MTHPLLIALYGKAGSGKSTLAYELAAAYGLPRASFAAPLKEGLYAMGVPVEGPEKDRELLQVVGTEVFRKLRGEDYWIKLLDEHHPDRQVTGLIIDDVRLLNEYIWCVEQGCLMVKLEGSFSPEYGPRAEHSTETGLDDLADDAWDVILPATTSVDERQRLVGQRLGEVWEAA